MPHHARPSRDWSAVATRLASEQLLSLTEAAATLPHVAGRKVSASTLWRWVLHGKRGVYLDAVRGHGRGWWTSREALIRFRVELSSLVDAEAKPRAESVSAWERRAKAAAEELERMGA